jgi:hypothetical protein
MALVHPFSFNDVDYPAAYSRVLFVRVDKADAYIFVNTYADEAARHREDMPVYQEEHRAEAAAVAGDVFVKAYDHLKTVPMFAEASDHPVADPADVVTPVEPAPVEPTQPEAQA